LTRLDAVVARPYDLEYHGVWSIDFATVERAWSPRSRAVLIVSPNNPTGSFVSSGDLTRLAAMAGSSGAALVADEVFADYELVPGGARAAGHCAACSSALTFSLGGLSKSVGLPQIKLGWMVVSGPEPLVTEALARVELVCDSYLSVSTPAQEAAGELLGRGAAIRQQIQARVSGNYRWLVEAAAPVASCRVLDAQGGWYGVVQVPSIATEEDLVLDLLRREGVLVHPGYFFDFPRESYLVVSLLTPSASFKQGISRILARFDAPGRP
jgi:aspartate/methionine/tyrosine aminotransferase